MLPKLSLFFLYYSPAQLLLLFLKHLCRNKSAAYKCICTDVPSACKQHKAAKFLQEIKELGYVNKGVHWRQNSCFRVFWTFIYHFPIPKHGVMAAVFTAVRDCILSQTVTRPLVKTLGTCLCCVIAVECGWGLCRLKYLVLSTLALMKGSHWNWVVFLYMGKAHYPFA